jgi:hypothetical protein
MSYAIGSRRFIACQGRSVAAHGGHIRVLPSGRFQVIVYAGTDPSSTPAQKRASPDRRSQSNTISRIAAIGFSSQATGR